MASHYKLEITQSSIVIQCKSLFDRFSNSHPLFLPRFSCCRWFCNNEVGVRRLDSCGFPFVLVFQERFELRRFILVVQFPPRILRNIEAYPLVLHRAVVSAPAQCSSKIFEMKSNNVVQKCDHLRCVAGFPFCVQFHDVI